MQYKVQLTGSRPVDLSHYVRHSRLVAHERRQVDRLRWIVLRERLHLTALPTAPLLRQEAERTVTWRRELTMRLHSGTHTHATETTISIQLGHFYV